MQFAASILWRRLQFSVALATAVCASAHAAPTLTPTAVSDGFSLSQFADGFPSSFSIGPLGIAFLPGGQVAVSDYPGNVRIFPTDSDSQHAGSVGVTYSDVQSNAVGLTRSGNFLYLAQQAANQVVRLKLDGTFDSVEATGIPVATGAITDPVTGHIFVGSGNGSGIFDIDPVSHSKTQFKTTGAYDGISISADGKTLYAELGGHIIGYRISDGGQVFDSGFINGGADGTELGAGTLAGEIFINTNSGELWEVNLANSSIQTLIVSGGSRGDFVTADPNGSLLFTQTSDIWRLTAPSGGCIGAACGGDVPEPGSLALVGIALLGLARTGRRLAGRA